MTRRIELIYDHDCPNVESARACLTDAIRRAGLSDEWTEWERGDPQAPKYVRRYGSPTILIDGEDVEPDETHDEGNCCRVYADEAGRLRGVPTVALVVRRLEDLRDD